VGGINLYVYVQNNPLNYIDPFGLEFQGTIGFGGLAGIGFGDVKAFFIGGSINIGTNTKGEIFLQVQSLLAPSGMGAYGGLGLIFGLGYAAPNESCSEDNKDNWQEGTQADVNIGWNKSAGGSASLSDEENFSFQISRRLSTGYGAQASVGKTFSKNIRTWQIPLSK
jgi:hypothetical protein